MSGVTRLSVVLMLAAMVAVTTAQTFQYSRGWTNGRKRSDVAPRPGPGGALPVLLSPQRRPPLSSHQSTKTIEERLRALEAGLSAVLKANSVNFSPGGDDEYYNDTN